MTKSIQLPDKEQVTAHIQKLESGLGKITETCGKKFEAPIKK